ncbi:DEAD/DEAH box helicase [Acidocella sp. KAb 2-4]|uniref:DEAD/DEAH box helicase n=1 Tax=Acidocella sp. KAb 2-4 TaxID=2885158 RepID=UPI001D05D582|nr:DEAD/DEAH box helicase [Acidocella sp. KAb 2-4]MCB5943708.1 DEAD/DEAH box helicase [Acidocella sp. KAb 2-4]
MTEMNFDAFGLATPILAALKHAGFVKPTPIQQGAIPHGLAGKDVLGLAQTGTGKTAAFALPILQAMAGHKLHNRRFSTRALILAPTRELAVQIEQEFKKFGAGLGLRVVLIVGGVGRSGQVARMSRGADIVVGCPGRVLDLMNTKELIIDQCQFFVLDEADRMLDLGFFPDIRKIVTHLPTRRQSALFSATMPAEIAKLAEGLLHDPVRVTVAAVASTPARIAQSVHFVEGAQKRELLVQLLRDPAFTRAIVFTRTKRGADRVALQLNGAKISATSLHGNLSQNARQRALDAFKSGEARVLVATDIAARGIDVSGVSHVVNFELPNEPESYVHRIGRTARNGAEGVAVAFCDATELPYLNQIEKLTGIKMQVASGTRPAQAMPVKKPQRHPDMVVRKAKPATAPGAKLGAKPRRPQYQEKRAKVA